MDRYYIFAGLIYYPSGGWEDYKGSSAVRQHAIDKAKQLSSSWGEWAHVVDIRTGDVIFKQECKS
jgi:hypothetical protein